MAKKTLSSAECICIEKRGFIPNRYYVYVLIVEWGDGDKHPIYRKYSSFYDFEKMLHDKIGHNGDIPELPTMNLLQKAFKIEKNHVTEINEFCMSILKLAKDVVDSHVVTSFFRVWPTDFPMEESAEESRFGGKKKEGKKKVPTETANHNPTDHSSHLSQSEKTRDHLLPSAPYEEITPSAPELEMFRPRAESMDYDLQVQEYISIMDYIPDSSSELSLIRGMKCVVLEKNDDGWWFIMRESDGHQGYAPGSFLVASSAKNSAEDPFYAEIPSLLNNNYKTESSNSEPIMKAKALVSYKACNSDEISCTKDEEVEVLGTDNTGWWTVRCNGKVGLVPAVHLEIQTSELSSRHSSVFMRNNSLYSRKPPPRRQRSTISNGDSDSVKDLIEVDGSSDPDSTEPGYATVLDSMAGRRVLAPTNKSKSEGTINYAELVFDDTEKVKVVKSSSNGVGSKPKGKKADTIIYTQIIPKNIRKAEDAIAPAPSPPAIESATAVGKKPERGKAVKKVAGTKGEETENHRKTPSPPTISVGRQSPIPIKPRAPRQEPTHSYENHVLPPPASNGEGPTYINLATGKVQATSDSDYLRRSSIDPPPPPAIEAPTPTTYSKDTVSSLESYSPLVSTIQAKSSYDGPSISGMLMFTKGDTAMLMSKGSDIGWWYVNLNGFEGYVPGGYWEPAHTGPSTKATPVGRQRAPQPVPRTHGAAPTSSTVTTTVSSTVTSTAPSTVTSSAAAAEKSTMDQEPWYHGKMSRPQSEKKLSNFTNGVFLIRESVNRVGDLTLSVKWETKVRHFPIEAKDGGLYNIGKHDFKTLHSVISHYSKHPLFYSETNEPVKLKNPASKL